MQTEATEDAQKLCSAVLQTFVKFLFFWRIRRKMTAMYRSTSLENKELMALYGDERDDYFVRDEDCTSEVRI